MQIYVDWFKTRKNSTISKVNLMLNLKYWGLWGKLAFRERGFSSGIDLAILQNIPYINIAFMI